MHYPNEIAYRSIRRAAERRGEQWLLSFEQWRRVWTIKGDYSCRGTTAGCQYMARIDSSGPWRYDNVCIRVHARPIITPRPDANTRTLTVEQWAHEIAQHK